MREKKRVLGSDLQKIDTHVITQEEYEESPELGPEFFERADEYQGGKLVQRGRGRPRSATRKVLLSVRYSPEVVEYFRAMGEGWQVRMNEVLRKYVKSAELRDLWRPSGAPSSAPRPATRPHSVKRDRRR